MIERDTEEQRFLVSARRALSPTPADAERVLGAVSRAIAISGSGATEMAMPEEGIAAPIGARLRQLVPRLLVAAALTGSSAAVGYGAGFRAGANTVATSGTARVTPPQPESSETRANAEKKELPHTTLSLDRTAREEAPLRPAPARGITKSPGPPRPSEAMPPELEANSLSEEVRTLRRVERALRDQNPRLALALLDDLDKAVPSGQLREERLAAATQARCSLGYGSPSALLEEFTNAHPGSAYLTRIHQACESQPPAAPNP